MARLDESAVSRAHLPEEGNRWWLTEGLAAQSNKRGAVSHEATARSSEEPWPGPPLLLDHHSSFPETLVINITADQNPPKESCSVGDVLTWSDQAQSGSPLCAYSLLTEVINVCSALLELPNTD